MITSHTLTRALPAKERKVDKFKHGDLVRKIKGSQWKGRVVGTYSTELTPEGYAVESDTEKGSVQIYPAAALELVREDQEPAPGVAGLVDALEGLAEQMAHDERVPNDLSQEFAAILLAIRSHRKQGGGQ